MKAKVKETTIRAQEIRMHEHHKGLHRCPQLPTTVPCATAARATVASPSLLPSESFTGRIRIKILPSKDSEKCSVQVPSPATREKALAKQ